MINLDAIVTWVLSGFFGGAGIIGLIMLWPRHKIEKTLKEKDKNEERLKKIDEHDIVLASIQEELAVITYGTLASLKGLAEKGCDGPVHDGIDRLEKYLNKKAHGI